jgi:hypothetical protein
MIRIRTLQMAALAGAFLSLASLPALAATVTIEAARDNTLYENSQGAVSNGAGDYLFVGRSQSGVNKRAVIDFGDLADIPEGATITAVRVHLSLSRENSPATTIRLHRLQADWGEGDSNASSNEGQGAASAANDATWIHSFFDTTTWASPGGDFVATASAEFGADAIGNYVVESTPELVADVQDWLDNPGDNHGWILVGQESSQSTKRFNSRENGAADSRPRLEVEYTGGAVSDWSGPWADPSLDGEGYLIYKTPVGWVIYFFGYTPGGEQLWLISDLVDVGEPEPGRSYSFVMSVGQGGTFEMPAPPDTLQEWGTLQVNFTDCGSGTFVLEAPGLLKISEVVKIIDVEGTQCAAD